MSERTDQPEEDAFVPEHFDAAAHAVAVSKTVGLVIAPERLPGVERYLNVAHSVARLALRVPLDEARFHMANSFMPLEPRREREGRDDG